MKQTSNLLKNSRTSSQYSQDVNQKSELPNDEHEKKTGQPTSLDLKKINLKKDPTESNSSL